MCRVLFCFENSSTFFFIWKTFSSSVIKLSDTFVHWLYAISHQIVEFCCTRWLRSLSQDYTGKEVHSLWTPVRENPLYPHVEGGFHWSKTEGPSVSILESLFGGLTVFQKLYKYRIKDIGAKVFSHNWQKKNFR